MEMGPLLQAIADGDTVAFVYEMYLTPKGMENAPHLYDDGYRVQPL